MGFSSYNLLKYLVFFVNLVFWVTGLTIIVLSIWMLTDSTFYMSMAQDESSYLTGIYIFLIVGTLMFVVGFFGCCGAIRESPCMLVLFFCLLLLILVAEVSAGVWAYANADDLDRLVRDSVRATIQDEYGQVDSRTETFDAIQAGLGCCGANGPTDWMNSRYNGGERRGLDLAVSSPLRIHRLPPSCCSRPDGPASVCSQLRVGAAGPVEPDSVYMEGCTEKLVATLHDYMSVIVGVGVAVAIAQCLGLAFALVLCCAIRQRDRYKA